MTTGLVVAVFVLVYLGMAMGRWPGLALDRTGVAVIGAIALFVSGAVDGALVLSAIDFPTLAILFALMVLSAQVAATNFFERAGAAIARSAAAPRRILLATVAVAGGLAAVLTNDVVVWAMTPVLIQGLLKRGLDPRPFAIALACAANAGSAATVIGNPQNLLIGQTGNLGFWPFLAVCGVPALVALGLVYAVTARVWRAALRAAPGAVAGASEPPPLERARAVKALVAAVAVIAAFTFPAERATWTLAVAGALLLSRHMTTRRMLSMVDWHLLLLFAGLFVVTGALAHTGALERAVAMAGGAGVGLGSATALAAVSLAGSNTIGNVPLVVLALSALPGLDTAGLYALALFSTLSGNLLVVGSIANIIVVERAKAEGVAIGFLEYARVGVPVTLASLGFAYGWIRALEAAGLL